MTALHHSVPQLRRRRLGVIHLVFFTVAASAPLTVLGGGVTTTFAVTETKELPQPFFAMAYDPQRDAFFSARWSGETLDFWNGDLTHRQSVSVDRPLGTSQGIAADGTYLFCARYAPHYLYIYDKDGRQLFDVPLVMGDLGEPEFLSVVDGVLYIGGNDPTWTGGYFAALELKDVTKGQAGGWKK